jgi:hypothetical protein
MLNKFELAAVATYELILTVAECAMGFIVGIIPGYRYYKYSLADGMMIRV